MPLKTWIYNILIIIGSFVLGNSLRLEFNLSGVDALGIGFCAGVLGGALVMHNMLKDAR
jgi:hypothetical protein